MNIYGSIRKTLKPVDKKLLENLSVVNLFFDGPGSEQAVNGDVTTLTDPPGSLATLHVGARVPVGVEDDHPEEKIAISHFFVNIKVFFYIQVLRQNSKRPPC